MIAAAIIGLLYAIDPGNAAWGANDVAILKYLPLELAACAAAIFALAGARGAVHWTVRCTQLLFGYMAVGSLVTLAMGAPVEDSFIGRALGLIAVYPAFRMFSSIDETMRFARPYRRAIAASAAAITVMMIVWQAGIHFVDQPHIFHEEVLIPAAAMLLAWISIADVPLRLFAVTLLLGGVLLTMKNTGFLAALACLSLLSVMLWRGEARSSRVTRIAVRALLVSVTALAAAAIVVVVLWFAELLPSGSPRVRLITYTLRLGQFVAAPLWGDGWIGTPLVSLSPSFREPSHSDLLDIAAFGGVASLALFLAPLVAFARNARADLVVFAERRHWLGGFFIAVVFVFVIQMAFNPMWNQPGLVVQFWLAVGFLAARAQRRHDQRAAARRP
jgi:hypothetical protein